MSNKVYDKFKNYIKENYKTLLIIIATFIVLTFELPYYVSAPGGVINTKDKVQISSKFKMEGSLNMAYVSEMQATLPILLYATINPKWDIKKEQEKTVGSESIKDVNFRNKLLLEEANNLALLVAYDYSDIVYTTENHKIYVTYVDDLAKTDLKVGDQIIKIGDTTITEKEDLFDYTKDKKPGDKITFTIKRDGKTINRKATLINVEGEAKVGVIITETMKIKSDNHVDLKFKGTESGSSGGMMMTLTLYSYLNEVDLTNGKKIAGTGTIDRDGNVGEISGIKYKLMGAVNKKVDIFLVPKGKNYNDAKKLKEKHGYDIKLVPIETFNDVLNYLEG